MSLSDYTAQFSEGEIFDIYFLHRRVCENIHNSHAYIRFRDTARKQELAEEIAKIEGVYDVDGVSEASINISTTPETTDDPVAVFRKVLEVMQSKGFLTEDQVQEVGLARQEDHTVLALDYNDGLLDIARDLMGEAKVIEAVRDNRGLSWDHDRVNVPWDVDTHGPQRRKRARDADEMLLLYNPDTVVIFPSRLDADVDTSVDSPDALIRDLHAVMAEEKRVVIAHGIMGSRLEEHEKDIIQGIADKYNAEVEFVDCRHDPHLLADVVTHPESYADVIEIREHQPGKTVPKSNVTHEINSLGDPVVEFDDADVVSLTVREADPQQDVDHAHILIQFDTREAKQRAAPGLAGIAGVRRLDVRSPLSIDVETLPRAAGETPRIVKEILGVLQTENCMTEPQVHQALSAFGYDDRDDQRKSATSQR